MRFRRGTKIVGLAFLGAAGILLAAGSYFQYAPRRTPEGQPPLARLDAKTIDRLAGLFDADKDKPRLLVLLSPT